MTKTWKFEQASVTSFIYVAVLESNPRDMLTTNRIKLQTLYYPYNSEENIVLHR